MLKVLRLVRIVKFLRYGKTYQQVIFAMKKSAGALVASFLFLLLMLFVISSALYYAEHGYWDPVRKIFLIEDCVCEASAMYVVGNRTCPPKESHFYSIMEAAWFTSATMTTVGYGDIVPQCPMGMFLAIIAMIIGTFFTAMPIGIVGAYYTLIVDQSKQTIRRVISQRSYSRSGSSGRTFSISRREVQEVEQDEEMYSIGEKMMHFLRRNVRDQDLMNCSLSTPPPSLMFFLNMYLTDFVEELARMPDHALGAPRQIATLQPCFHTTKTQAFTFGASKYENFPVKLHSVRRQELRSKLQELIPFMGDQITGSTIQDVLDQTAQVHVAASGERTSLSQNGSLSIYSSRTVASVVTRHRIDPSKIASSVPTDHSAVAIRIADKASMMHVTQEGEEVKLPTATSAEGVLLSVSRGSTEAAMLEGSSGAGNSKLSHAQSWVNRIKHNDKKGGHVHSLLRGRRARLDEQDQKLSDRFYSAEKSLFSGSVIEILLPDFTLPLYLQSIDDDPHDVKRDEERSKRKVTFRFLDDNADIERQLRSFHAALEIEKALYNPFVHGKASSSKGDDIGGRSGLSTGRTTRSFFDPPSPARRKSAPNTFLKESDESEQLAALTRIRPSTLHNVAATGAGRQSATTSFRATGSNHQAPARNLGNSRGGMSPPRRYVSRVQPAETR